MNAYLYCTVNQFLIVASSMQWSMHFTLLAHALIAANTVDPPLTVFYVYSFKATALGPQIFFVCKESSGDLWQRRLLMLSAVFTPTMPALRTYSRMLEVNVLAHLRKQGQLVLVSHSSAQIWHLVTHFHCSIAVFKIVFVFLRYLNRATAVW